MAGLYFGDRPHPNRVSRIEILSSTPTSGGPKPETLTCCLVVPKSSTGLVIRIVGTIGADEIRKVSIDIAGIGQPDIITCETAVRAGVQRFR